MTSGAHVLYGARLALNTATGTRLAGNSRVADMFQKAGVELGSPLKNLAAGATATASYTAPDTSAANAVDGWTSSGPTVAPGAYVLTPSFAAYNPIWGSKGSPNAQDWLELDLGVPRRFDTLKLYFYSNKELAAGPVPQGPAVEGNTYREPAAYTVQYLAGDRCVDAGAPSTADPNYNRSPTTPSRSASSRRSGPTTRSGRAATRGRSRSRSRPPSHNLRPCAATASPS